MFILRILDTHIQYQANTTDATFRASDGPCFIVMGNTIWPSFFILAKQFALCPVLTTILAYLRFLYKDANL